MGKRGRGNKTAEEKQALRRHFEHKPDPAAAVLAVHPTQPALAVATGTQLRVFDARCGGGVGRLRRWDSGPTRLRQPRARSLLPGRRARAQPRARHAAPPTAVRFPLLHLSGYAVLSGDAGAACDPRVTLSLSARKGPKL